MAVYAIGDIQGCYDSLRWLLTDIEFDRERDRLILLGDLVNRGPQSLAVLRWAYQLRDSVKVVLGNHDIHLLATAVGARRSKRHDTLDDILEAPDRDELIDWLRKQALYHEDGEVVAVHAGLHPAWSLVEARALAADVEKVLRSDDWREQLTDIYASRKRPWSSDLRGSERLRAIINVMVRVRTCTAEGDLCKYIGPPETAPEGCHAWFDIAPERFSDRLILFGHWATLGLRVAEHYGGLDSGCVWGGQLSALRVDDRIVFQVDAVEA